MTLFAMLYLSACETKNATGLTDGIWTFLDMSTNVEYENIISLVSLQEALLSNAAIQFQEGGP